MVIMLVQKQVWLSWYFTRCSADEVTITIAGRLRIVNDGTAGRTHARQVSQVYLGKPTLEKPAGATDLGSHRTIHHCSSNTALGGSLNDAACVDTWLLTRDKSAEGSA